MIYTSKPRYAVFSVVLLLLLATIDSSAAYRIKKMTANSQREAQAEETRYPTWDGNPSPVKYKILKQYQQLVVPDKTERRILTSGEVAVATGTAAVLFALLGLVLLHGVGGSISSLSALIGVGVLGILTPFALGAIAIGYGIKGITVKKQKVSGIIGLILGAVAVATAIAIILI